MVVAVMVLVSCVIALGQEGEDVGLRSFSTKEVYHLPGECCYRQAGPGWPGSTFHFAVEAVPLWKGKFMGPEILAPLDCSALNLHFLAWRQKSYIIVPRGFCSCRGNREPQEILVQLIGEIGEKRCNANLFLISKLVHSCFL